LDKNKDVKNMKWSNILHGLSATSGVVGALALLEHG